MTPTATPWTIRQATCVKLGDKAPDTAILGPNNEIIAESYNQIKKNLFVNSTANAQHIVHCVNNFPKLLTALDFARSVIVEMMQGEGDRGAWQDGLNEVTEAIEATRKVNAHA